MKKLKGLLAVSLLTNVMLGGIIVGHLSHRWGHSMITAIQESLKTSSLPKARQEALQMQLVKVRQEGKATHKEIRAAHKALLAILAAPVFDGQAYDIQIDHVHTLYSQQLNRVSKTIKETAEEMNPAERAALADALRHLSQKK
ncbi:hypothetical conserved protein [Candidatus Nitrosoglobus terrae]|uniref:Signaling pathway modulator ZraP n=1 Tax=Candidatus Nitrosoglobus terrae TaxID=1630141 RepID=A0A1Q2SPB1_9GAMM|nr:periplasmic heavy metal sensor [Candidatus Nitrosoglobus terrae]BAW80974.1 hypothetical conserved protein [Candidatus Nitrosoglobus terrae]